MTTSLAVMSPPTIAAEPLTRVQHRRKRFVAFSGGLLLAAMLFTESLWADGGLMHHLWEWIGYALIVTCILGRTWCALYIGGRKKQVLVDQGPYSLSRNPLYLFSLLGGIGVGLQAGNLVAGLVFGLFVFVIFTSVIQREEAFLRGRFPAEFAAYAARVPRWGPRFSNWHSDAEMTVQPRFVLLTFRDALAFLIAIPVLEGIEMLQVAGWLPVLLRLP